MAEIDIDYCICLGRKDPSEPVPRIKVLHIRRRYYDLFRRSYLARFSPQFSDLPHSVWDELDPLAYWDGSPFAPKILETK